MSHVPTFDADGYPTDETLERISSWTSDPHELMAYLREAWRYEDYFAVETRDTGDILYRLSTAGWSGNESLISALEGNLFWMLYWKSSRRGGHYTFEVPSDVNLNMQPIPLGAPK